MRDWNDYGYHFKYEDEDEDIPVFEKIAAGILVGGFTLFLFAVLAKVAVVVWTGGCAE